jgi:thioredoxin reductase (NADPH)
MREFDLIVIGAGVAGLTAAAHAARRGVKVAVIERVSAGGQIAATESIENFPGFPQGLSGVELGPLLHEQAEAAGTEFVLDSVESVTLDDAWRVAGCISETMRARAIIMAAGSTPRSLEVPGEQTLLGRGVSHCASCDGHFFTDQEVCVVGGGDSALDEALALAEHAARVTVIHRHAEPTAQRALVERVATIKNIELLGMSAVVEILGTEKVTGIRVRDMNTGVTSERAVRGVFIYVGLEPNTALLQGLVALDHAGHVVTDIMMQTSVPGIFAAGDIRAQSVAQLAAVAGDGATAAIAAFRYLSDKR